MICNFITEILSNMSIKYNLNLNGKIEICGIGFMKKSEILWMRKLTIIQCIFYFLLSPVLGTSSFGMAVIRKYFRVPHFFQSKGKSFLLIHSCHLFYENQVLAGMHTKSSI